MRPRTLRPVTKRRLVVTRVVRTSLPLLALLFLLHASSAHADTTAQIVGGRIALATPLAFDARSGTLDASDAPLLDAVATLLRSHPTMTIEIGAHTDSRGSEAYNLRTTQAIADAVQRALVTRGIAASRLSAVGYGESRPIADDATAAGRAANRRVELVVVHP